MVCARRVWDPKVSAQEGRSKFGDHLLDRIRAIAKALSEFPVAAALGAAFMGGVSV
jgi:hypothetical protein